MNPSYLKSIARRLLALTLLLALASALFGPAAPARAEPPAPQAGGDDEPRPGPPAAWDVVDAAAPVPSVAPQAPDAATAAAGDCLGSATRRIRYTSDGVIHLEGCGQIFRLSDVAATPGMSPDRIQLVDPANKIWLLKVKLKVEEGATLRVIGGAGGDASWLRLRSDSASAVWLRAENGTLLFRDTRVTSWDITAGAPDTNIAVGADGSGGRAYMAVRSVLTKGRATAAPSACATNGGSQEPYEGRMDIANSEIGYLGYSAAESYGVAWKVYYKVNAADPTDAPPPGRQLYAIADVFGNVSGSTFHHNYFGSYTFGGYCMNWSGNTFANNIQYGLDPHDDSDYLTIENNIFRDNGNHGVICSVYCDHLVIRNNQSLRNQHGIMLHRNTDGALVEGNLVRDNRGAGIAIFDSHDAVVRNNTVANNGESALRLSVGASRNLIEGNTLTGLATNGVGSGYVIYTFKGSDLPTSGDGRPKNNVFRANSLTAYKSPVFKIGDATGNLFAGNTLAGTTADLRFANSTGSTLRDTLIGTTFRVLLDSASTVRLEDTRGAVWQLSRPGLATTAAPSSSSLGLTYASAGASVDITTLDLAVRPQSGAVAVQPQAWQASTRSWSEGASGSVGAVSHRLGGLAPGACYSVVAGGASLGVFTADGAGRIAFSRGLSGTAGFAVTRMSQCPALAPASIVLVPVATR
jgi:parallel beta-helix repeat protein